jgi:hypothetical protein
MEPTTILESQLYSSKACQPFVPGNFAFGNYYFTYQYLHEYTNGRWGLGLVQPIHHTG